MNEAPLGLLGSVLFFLIIISAFFSGSETAMMSLNRYRLQHLAKQKHRGAIRAKRLLKRPDRLIGVILIGNNFVNNLAASISTIIAIRLWGDNGIAAALMILTVLVLIFAEVSPKTIAATQPERIAFPASYILNPLLKILYPLVWLINGIANRFIRLLGFTLDNLGEEKLTTAELRTVVDEGAKVPGKRQGMLLSILDLEKVTVDDIMVPRHEVVGIDLADDKSEILAKIASTQYTRIPVYEGELNNIKGILHIRNIARILVQQNITHQDIVNLLDEPYFIPESTALHKQLVNFQANKQRLGLVVDEYGDIQGLVALEDILEEIVGEFTTDLAAMSSDIHPQEDGSYLIDGSALVRDINRALDWQLPIDGPKTLSGLIMEYLEDIPDSHVGFRLKDYQIEIIQIKGNMVKTAKIITKHD